MSKQTKTALDPIEIEQLISVYHSELRQLNYRVLSVRKNIEQLETALSKQSQSKRQSVVIAPTVVATKTVEINGAATAVPIPASTPTTQTSSNKKGNIVRVSFDGPGFAYALPKWLNPAGELKEKFRSQQLAVSCT